MKILFLLTYYYPHWTGLTEHAKRLAEAFSNNKDVVTVVTTQHEESLKSSERIKGVTVIRTPIWFRISRTCISPSFLLHAWEEIGKTDIVIAYTPVAEVLILALFSKLQRKRLVLIHNGDLILPKGIINRALEKVFDVTTYLSGVLADQLIAYSQDYAEHSRFLQYFPNKTVPILPLFPRYTVNETLKKQLAFRIPQNHTPIIGFAGRFVEEKGFDVLLKAIPLVIKQFPKAIFVFAGETHMVYEQFFEKNTNLLESVQNNFFSFGLLSREEMTAFYSLLDVFVLPSRSDCLAFVQVEAMLAGVPVVATDIPGARVAVLKTGMGEIVPSESPEELAQGIAHVVQKKTIYRKKKTVAEKLFNVSDTFAAFERGIKGKQ